MPDTFIYEDIDFETVRSWARRNTLPFETAADLTLINLERKRMMLPGWRISAHVFGSSALPYAEEIQLVEDAQAVGVKPAPVMRRVRGAAKQPAPVPGPISSHVPVTEPVAPPAEPEMSLQSLLGYMSAVSRKKPGSAQEVLKTRHGFLSARSVPPAMRAQLALEMTVEASKPNVAEATGFIQAAAIDPGMPLEGFLACIRRASRKKPGSAQAVLTVKHKYLSAFDVPPALRAQLAQEMTDESGEPAAVALAQGVAVEVVICEPEPVIADPAPAAMSLSSFCGRAGAASRRTPGVAQAVMYEHGFQHAGDVPDEMRAQIVQEIAAAATKLAVEQEPDFEPDLPAAEMALPSEPEILPPAQKRKTVERSLHGVAEALFDAFDGLRDGSMPLEEVRLTCDLSVRLATILAAEAKLVEAAERATLPVSRASLLRLAGGQAA